MIPTTPSSPPLNQSSLAGSSCSIATRLSPRPPVLMTTMSGVRISAKIISVACTVSVQLTARKPPTSVYRIVAAAPYHSACAYGRPNTLSNRRAPATIPLAA